MSTQELQNKLIETMQRWQKIEDAAVKSTGDIIAKTENPVIRLVMECIQRDSQFHHRVQGFITESMTGTMTFDVEDLADIWDSVEKHLEIEKQTIHMAQEALEGLKGKKMVIAEYLLNYLMVDEEKHTKLLEDMEVIKKGMYPYG